MQAVLTAAHRDFDKGLTAHAYFKMNDRALSQDLVQDTFMKTWKYLVKGGKIDTMKAFLYHVLNFLIVDEYRKHKATSLDVLVESGYEPSTGDHERIFDVIDGSGALLMISKLSLKYRAVMRMKYIQDLSIAEISAITGQSKNTVAVQMHRGLAQLKLIYVR